MAMAELLLAHYGQMRDEGFPVYGIFDVIEKAALSDQDRAALLEPAAGLVETVIHCNMQSKVNATGTAQRLIELGMPEALVAFTAWQTTAARTAMTSNRALKMVLDSFGVWVEKSQPHARAAFCEVAPELAHCMHSLKEDGVLELIDAANSLGTPDDCGRVMGLLAQYGMTDGKTVSAMFRIARRACQSDRIERFEELVAAVPALKVINSHDAQRLIPSLDKLAKIFEGQDDPAWPNAFDLVVALAKRRLAAAHIAARDLPKRIKDLPEGTAVRYVQGFAMLVETVGPGVLDFGLNKLPALYQAHGAEPTHAFVQAAASATECFGTTAGFHFLGRKTAAARELLPD